MLWVLIRIALTCQYNSNEYQQHMLLEQIRKKTQDIAQTVLNKSFADHVLLLVLLLVCDTYFTTNFPSSFENSKHMER